MARALTLPDGEVLRGKYTTSGAVSPRFTLTSQNTPNGTVVQGQFGNRGYYNNMTSYALLTSTQPGSKLVIELIIEYGVGGGGIGEARSNDGRRFRVQF